MAIILNNVCWVHPDREVLFQNIGFSVGDGEKAALIGDNGAGKSTLLRIMAGLLQPSSGSVSLSCSPYYVPQHSGQCDAATVAGALGIAEKTGALHAILSGDACAHNYTLLGEDWDIEERAAMALASWGLEHIALEREFASLSGGEQTRVLLAAAALHDPQIILLDEPSNHLDAPARKRLYDFVRTSRATIVVVSHDRMLLDLIDTTFELSANGIALYGGNYDFYRKQKDAESESLAGAVAEKQKALRAARETAQQAAQRKQRMDSRGEHKQSGEGQSRIMMNTLRNRAENSNSHLKGMHQAKIEAIEEGLRSARAAMPTDNELKIKLNDSSLHRGKILVEACDMNFGYGRQPLWSDPLSFVVTSGERIAVKGRNGSGKTTLIKLLTGEIEPTHGHIARSAFSHTYIDQQYSLVDDHLTVVRQAERYNLRNLPEHEIKTELHRFLLPASSWDKPCGALSGGEKMKLIFCCLLIGNSSPDMLILDEPTNNLDIRSLEIVTSALKHYRGTLIVVSHDEYFLREIGIHREIALPDKA